MKRRVSKVLLAIFVCFALLVSVSACGGSTSKTDTSTNSTSSTGKSTTQASTAETKKEPVTLTFSTFNAWWTNGVVQKAVQMYQDETGNKVDPQIFPDDQFRNVISTKLASGDTPDVFAFYANVSLLNTDLLEPLEGPWTSKIDMNRAKATGYVSLKDNKFYTAPYSTDTFQGVIYNKDILKSAGITPPFKTYNDFITACDTLKKAGVTPVMLPIKDGWTAQIVFYTGSAYIPLHDPQFGANMASNKLKPSQVPALIDLSKKMLALKTKGYTNADAASTTMPMAEQALAEGKAAMVFGGDWQFSDFTKNYSDKAASIGMTACNWSDDPSDLSVVKGTAGSGMFVPVASKHKAEAKDFVNFIMTDKVIQAMCEVSPGITELNGIQTKASDWDAEMQSLVDSGTAKMNDSFIDAVNHAFLGSQFDQGDLSAMCGSIFTGKNITKALDDWYTEYAKINKAKKVSGF